MPTINIVTPETVLPSPFVNKNKENKVLLIDLPKINHSALKEDTNNLNTKFKYVIHIRKLKRNGVKDKFYKLGEKILTYKRKNKLKFSNMYKGIYSIRYQVIITKGNKIKSTRWSKRTLVEI